MTVVEPTISRTLNEGFYCPRGFGCFGFYSQEMHRETMEMFSRGLPLWQRLLVPTLAPGLMSTMSEGLRLTEQISANMRIVERAFG